MDLDSTLITIWCEMVMFLCLVGFVLIAHRLRIYRDWWNFQERNFLRASILFCACGVLVPSGRVLNVVGAPSWLVATLVWIGLLVFTVAVLHLIYAALSKPQRVQQVQGGSRVRNR